MPSSNKFAVCQSCGKPLGHLIDVPAIRAISVPCSCEPQRSLPAILLVTRSDSVAYELAFGLQTGEFRVISVRHPRHALEAVTFREFAAIVLDSNLPELQSSQLSRQLQNLSRQVPIILRDVAGRSAELSLQATKVPADCDLEELLEAIRRTLDETCQSV